MNYIIGIDIGGTTSRVSLGLDNNGDLSILSQSEVFSTPEHKPYELIDKFITFINEVKESYTIRSIGISCGGPLNSKTGVILSPPNLPGWDEIEIVRILEEKTGLNAYLCNDANAGALTEWMYGAGKGTQNMVFLTFGTGMGAGLILDGKLYAGTNDMAGEVGHVRLASMGPSGYGKIGSFEGFCSGGGIAQYAQLKALEAKQKGTLAPWIENVTSLTAKDIGIHANQGDPFALEVMDEVSTNLGYGLSLLIDILNPERIVIGSIYQRNESIMKEVVEQTIAKESLPLSAAVCEIVKADLEESIGDLSALTVARYFEEN